MSSQVDALANALLERMTGGADPVQRQRIISMIASGQAPGRIHQRGEKGLWVSNVFRAVLLKDWNLAKEEKAVSDQLAALGFPMSEGSLLFPLYPAAIPESHKALREEIAEKMLLPAPDAAELAWHLKRHPEFAKKAFGLSQKDLELGDDTLGGFLVPATQSTRLIDLLRGRAVLVRAGAQEVPLPPTGNITYPTLTSDPSFTWTDPDSTTDASTATATFGTVRLQAKSLRGYVTIPNDLLRYSSPAAEAVVRMALASKAATAEDNQFLEGAGSSLAPRGLMNFPRSVNAVTAGKVTDLEATTKAANGDTFEPEDCGRMYAVYEESKDFDPPTAWICRPTFFWTIANRRADAVSAADKKGPFLFPVTRGDMGQGVRKELLGVPVFTTTQLSKNQTKGTATTLHSILLGNFNRMLIGRSGAIELAASEHVKWLQDKTVLKAILRSDMNLEYAESFVLCRNLLES